MLSNGLRKIMNKIMFRMKNLISSLTVLVASALLFSCVPKKSLVQPVTKVYAMSDTAGVTDGSLLYALPMTVFNITVEFRNTIEKPGPYAKYASEMLGIKDVITHERETWAISRISVRSSEELDPSEFYIIEASAIVQTNAFSLKRAGLIMNINPAVYDNMPASLNEAGVNQVNLRFDDLGADEYFVTQSDTAYRVVKLDTAFIKIPYLVEKKKLLIPDQLADKAAKTLLELRDGKQRILNGEANIFPQSNAGIDEINRIEKEYLALFTGKTLVESKTLSFTVIPQKEQSGKPVTIFKFSEEAGPSTQSAGPGTPVVMTLQPAGKTKDITIVTRSGPGGKDIEAKTWDKLYYRVPDVVTVKITRGNESLFESRKLVYQFGQVVQLPANFILGK
jgi:hypothetical protein